MNFVFYDDSPTFGGHEVMTLVGVAALLAGKENRVDFLASAANAPLLDKLHALAAQWPQLRIRPVAEKSSKLEALRHRLRPGRIAVLAAELSALQPDLVIAVQGNIEHSSLALLASRHAGLKAASYIPVPHSNAEMGAKLGGLRDRFTPYLFRQPQAFVTISDEMAAMLRARGATCPIEVVYNGIDTARFQARPQAECRARLQLPTGRRLIGMVGRLEFRQKRQDLLVRAIASDPSLAATCHLVFAGEGPDRAALATLIASAGLEPHATLLPWSDPADLYPSLDALVIPSRYEGLPLVMLEALACGIPVLASDRDGMRDLLPADWRFTPGSIPALAATLRRLLDAGAPSAPAALVHRVRDTMNLTAFSTAFRACLEGLAASA